MNRESVNGLVEEYRAVIGEVAEDANADDLVATLVRDADWTTNGAEAIVHLAREYGVFVLKNALALACVLDIEDGELGI